LVDAYYKLPNDVELFGKHTDKPSTPEATPILRKALETIGLALPREISVTISADQKTCTLNDLDTNPQHVDTVLGEDSDPPDPQLCLLMPDRDRQYDYRIIKEGEADSEELYLKLPLLRQERLGNDVLLCLFQGNIQRVDVHLKPETLHFGLKRETDGSFSKELKGEKGEETGIELHSREMDNFWKTEESKSVGGGTLNVENIAARIEKTLPTGVSSNSARFALQMMEKNELVRFTVK
ncbi:MAG: hypothetical protein V7677_20270, partial [Motiliproteus sp.]